MCKIVWKINIKWKGSRLNSSKMWKIGNFEVSGSY